MTEPGTPRAYRATNGHYGGWQAMFPPLRWLAGYPAAWLKFDLLAGLTLAAYAIPVSLAYAALAGLPPQTGLYGYLFGGLGYALFGSSKQLAVGPTSAISLIFGLTLAQLAAGDPGRLPALVTVTTMMVVGCFALAWVLRLSVFVNFISDSILVGFKAGAALAIAATQLPKLFGVPGGGDNFFQRLWTLGRQLGDTNPWVFAFGMVAIALLAAGAKWSPSRPVALVVVVLSLIAEAASGLSRQGFPIVGEVPAGLPVFDAARFSLAGLDTGTFRQMAQLAFACFLLAYIESISAARALALKHGYEIDPRQELLGLGAANLAAGLFQGYPSAGGLSQSAVNEKAGARTPLALVFASIALGLVLLCLTGVFRNLPTVVLAAVVLVAVASLVSIRDFRRLWRVNRLDFGAALTGLAGVLLLGILDGVIFAVIASLLLLLVRSTTPHVAFLGRIPGTHHFSDLARHPDNELLKGVLAFRVEAALVYFNVEHVRRAVLDGVERAPAGLKLVVCDLSNSPYVDMAGAKMLVGLHDELEWQGIDLRVVEAHATERDLLRAEGLEKIVGPINRRISLDDVLEEFDRRPPANGG